MPSAGVILYASALLNRMRIITGSTGVLDRANATISPPQHGTSDGAERAAEDSIPPSKLRAQTPEGEEGARLLPGRRGQALPDRAALHVARRR